MKSLRLALLPLCASIMLLSCTGTEPNPEAAGTGSGSSGSSVPATTNAAPVAGPMGKGSTGVPGGNVTQPSGEGGEGGAAEAPKIKRWTGISMANLKEPIPGVDADQRCQVTHVYRGSPGDRSGVKEDDVIIAANDVPVKKFQDISTVTRGQPPGFTFNMKVLRKGQELTFPVTIEAKPDDMRARLKEAWEGTPMLPFTVQGLNQGKVGKVLSSDQYKGKVLVLDFWATWCGPCRTAMPVLERLQKELGPKGLVVLGVSSEETKVIQDFMTNNPLGYQVAHDPVGEMKQDYEIDKLPTLYVIDQKGIVQEVGIGSGHLSALEATLRRLLG
ncbi:MAG: redoxin domain-containing protein [Myxococcota bacterium]